ncbi:ATP-dependent helicase (plasmid) [Rhizobium leguminosarum]|uniref:ATP-dependent helicase n=1 Tax=Rhizobium leguminosarum TaxID=384 RepID=UPI001030208E|nr:ATP-dependent helicase [Rhizobium leguminosarum]TAX46516.1 ATP-dependent helicase [Rhizobium leguminosarum]
MSSDRALLQAMAELNANPEQAAAVVERGHCVVLAGPGSGKTKTLTTAMARVLAQDVVEPRGVACITYNNECAIELETRLVRLGVSSGDRAFIGTVHGFALSQVISPYVRCVPVGLPSEFRVATHLEVRAAVEVAYRNAIDDDDDPHRRWKFASEKRKRDVDRSRPEWWGHNPELATFIEAYEAELRRQGLLDFDDMPLLAYRMIKENPWIRDALRARFPVLFVDEYQDLGHALHELVLLLCFGGGIRLFAVGDADQSIYAFAGANPELLESLVRRADVRTIRLRFNYRSGGKIIRASLGALGEERDYRGVDGAHEGGLSFWHVPYGHDSQAQAIADTIIPKLVEQGFEPGQIAVLYRTAKLGDKVAVALKDANIPFVRTDTNALVKRSSRFARFIEDCARWATGGWRDADPPYVRLLSQAKTLVFGRHAREKEELDLSAQLMAFLHSSIGSAETTHEWLQRFSRELITPWRKVSRNTEQEWEICSQMITNTDPTRDLDLALAQFAGHVEGAGRVNLSTLHSAKGREFDAVIMYGVNASDFPSERDSRTPAGLREARRLFYVGVTRPKKHLSLIYQEHHHSPWVVELYQRSQRA